MGKNKGIMSHQNAHSVRVVKESGFFFHFPNSTVWLYCFNSRGEIFSKNKIMRSSHRGAVVNESN